MPDTKSVYSRKGTLVHESAERSLSYNPNIRKTQRDENSKEMVDVQIRRKLSARHLENKGITVKARLRNGDKRFVKVSLIGIIFVLR